MESKEKNIGEQKRRVGQKEMKALSRARIVSTVVGASYVLTPRSTALVAAAKTGSPAFTIWPKETAPDKIMSIKKI